MRAPGHLRWLFLVALAVVGVAIGVLIVQLRGPERASATQPPATPVVSWAAGARRAPGFALRDQDGKPVSMAAYRNRPVIVTFLDPLCRNLCPVEAKILGIVESSLPASERPVILAVSVNQWGNQRAILRADMWKWHVAENWHWAVGPPAALRRIWAAYKIAVVDAPKTIQGVTVHNISHTEAAYLVDGHGDERALYVYPFRASDVEGTLRQLASQG
jgi:cytochrome oxidase Cu insertion factor (SCO1/SenC/PrrC family)